MNMKKTAFYSIHRDLGAKIVEFAGFQMPIQYSGIHDEHKTVRESVGVFDVSHMGEFEVRGRDASALVQRVTTNNAAKLNEGKIQYSAMCYPDGGIVDDLLVYRLKDGFMLVVNASNIKKDYDWIVSNSKDLNAEVIDKSDKISLLAVQGPRSGDVLQKLTKVQLSVIPYYSFVHGSLAGVDMLISRTGYTGELGYELYFPSDESTARNVWNAIFEAGKEFGIKPIGLAARDTLRLEMGFCLYGNDIDQTTNPLEAGLGWITKFEKGAFIGSEALQNVKKEGLKRKLVGFILEEPRAFPRHGYEIRLGRNVIGHVTSGTVSPVLEQGIGLGYVTASVVDSGSRLQVLIRDKDTEGRIVPLPFIHK
jgi:aminomethyltransferase